jgi:hypothetical protein
MLVAPPGNCPECPCVKTALVVMMEETGVQTENQQQVTDKLYYMKLFKGNFTICRNQADKVSVNKNLLHG